MYPAYGKNSSKNVLFIVIPLLLVITSAFIWTVMSKTKTKDVANEHEPSLEFVAQVQREIDSIIYPIADIEADVSYENGEKRWNYFRISSMLGCNFGLDESPSIDLFVDLIASQPNVLSVTVLEDIGITPRKSLDEREKMKFVNVMNFHFVSSGSSKLSCS